MKFLVNEKELQLSLFLTLSTLRFSLETILCCNFCNFLTLASLVCKCWSRCFKAKVSSRLFSSIRAGLGGLILEKYLPITFAFIFTFTFKFYFATLLVYFLPFKQLIHFSIYNKEMSDFPFLISLVFGLVPCSNSSFVSCNFSPIFPTKPFFFVSSTDSSTL